MPLLVLVVIQADTWRKIRSKLRDPSVGRVMARLGPATLWQQGQDQLNPTTIEALIAMSEAFDGEEGGGGSKGR